MASNKTVRIGPVALGTSAGNIANPPTLTGGTGLAGTNVNTYLILKHLRIVNKSGAAVPASLFIGLTGGNAAGTEFAFSASSIPAGSNNWVDWYGLVRLDAADFLTGLAGAAGALTVEGEAEIGIV